MAYIPSSVVLDDSMDTDEMPRSVAVSYSPGSPGGKPFHSVGGRGKHAKQQQYNRSSIDMMNYLQTNPEDITAKTYRTLIPMMFQTWLHPDKDLLKTKVKGLWDAGNKPTDWDEELPGVVFKDPNNAPKLKLEANKKIFLYLRKKLLEMSSIRRTLRMQNEPPRRKSSHGKYMPMSPAQIPNLEAFQPHLKQHAFNEREKFIQESDARFQPTENYSDNLAIPMTVQEFCDEDVALARDQGIEMRPFDVNGPTLNVPYPDPGSALMVNMHEADSTSCMPLLAEYGGPTPSQPVQVLNDQYMPDGNRVLELAVLHTIKSEPQSPTQTHSLCVVSDEDTRRPIEPESADQPDSTALGYVDPQCNAFVQEIYRSLMPSVQEHWKMFSAQTDVINQTSHVMKGVLEPLKNDALKSKQHCLSLNEFCSKFLAILKRARIEASLQDTYCTADLVKELQLLCGEYGPQEILQVPVPESFVPEMGNEVVVMRAEMETNHATLFQASQDLYIPTVDDMRARAGQKAREIEGEKSPSNMPYFKTAEEIEACARKKNSELEQSLPLIFETNDGMTTKVTVETMPYGDSILSPGLVNRMNTMDLDPEKDFGVALKEEILLNEAEGTEEILERSPELDQLLDEIDFLSNQGVGEDTCRPVAPNTCQPTYTPVSGTSFSYQVSPSGYLDQNATLTTTFAGNKHLSGGLSQDNGAWMGNMMMKAESEASDMSLSTYLTGNCADRMAGGFAGIIEDKAIHSILADAQKHFGGSMTTDRPMSFDKNPAFSDSDGVVEDVLELERVYAPYTFDLELNNSMEILTPDATPCAQEGATLLSPTEPSTLITTTSPTMTTLAPNWPTVLPLPCAFNPETAVIPITVFEKASGIYDVSSPPRKRGKMCKTKGYKARGNQQKTCGLYGKRI